MRDYSKNEEGDSISLQPAFFPGTCINNTSVMMFRKGSFEIGGTVYPVAIKVVVSAFFSSPFFWGSDHMFVLLVWPTIWWRLLGEQQVRHGELPVEDNEQLGHGLQRLVPATNEQTGEADAKLKHMFISFINSIWYFFSEKVNKSSIVCRYFREPNILVSFFLFSACREVKMLYSLPTEWKQQ